MGGFLRRPQNACKHCGWTWSPRGHNVSRRCPECGSPEVEIVNQGTPIALVGCAAILVVAFVVGYGLTKSQLSGPSTVKDLPKRTVETPPIKDKSPEQQKPPIVKSEKGSISVLVTADGSECNDDGMWVLYSTSGKVGEGRVTFMQAFLLENLEPGEKTLHVLPSWRRSELSCMSLHINVEPSQMTNVVAPLVRGRVAQGRVSDSRGVNQAYVYVQIIQPTIGGKSFPFSGSTQERLMQQATAGGPFETIKQPETARLDRWNPIRIIRSEGIMLGTFTDADGKYSITGLHDRLVRIQVSNSKELLYDRLHILDNQELRLEVPVAETVTDTNTRIVAFLDRLPIEGLDVAIRNHLAGFPSSRPAIRIALLEAIQGEKNPSRKVGLERILSAFK